MKRNDFATFLVYVAMIAIALLVGFLVIKPIIDTHSASLPLQPIVIMLLGLVAGVLLNALFLELGHYLGARLGKYEILKWVVLGMGFVKVEGKLKPRFSGFDGLSGETKVAPKDAKESSLSAYIMFPILFLFAEFILCMVLIVLFQGQEANNPSISWVRIFLSTILTVAGMIYLYDLFPAHIDSTTDGYLLVLLTKPANKEAYNNLLLAQAAAFEGKPIPETPIYEDITDFTAGLNLLTAYRRLVEGNPKEALPILEAILAAETGPSSDTVAHAMTLKLTTLLEEDDREKGNKYYEELTDDEKKYIANMGSLSALRAYLLIAAFIEGSDSETNYAIDKAEKAIKNCDPSFKEAEKSLLQLDVDLVRAAHPNWEVYLLPWEEKEQPKE
ncbi:MAG: hypothetical protein K6E59_03255 [Bacilli bacterium]|nr:hypothetical protein [Bacilli bacterium]